MAWRSKFLDQPNTRAQGRLGEDDAVRWLRKNGYRIVARNVRNRAGEIDVIGWHGETLCFIEVKARSTTTYGPAIEAVTPAKQRRIARTAAAYLAGHPVDAPCRFDVLALDLIDGHWRIQLVPGAFEAPSR